MIHIFQSPNRHSDCTPNSDWSTLSPLWCSLLPWGSSGWCFVVVLEAHQKCSFQGRLTRLDRRWMCFWSVPKHWDYRLFYMLHGTDWHSRLPPIVRCSFWWRHIEALHCLLAHWRPRTKLWIVHYPPSVHYPLPSRLWMDLNSWAAWNKANSHILSKWIRCG